MSLVGFKARNHPQQTSIWGQCREVDDRALPSKEFAKLNARFRFTLDAAASPHNAKLPRFHASAFSSRANVRFRPTHDHHSDAAYAYGTTHHEPHTTASREPGQTIFYMKAKKTKQHKYKAIGWTNMYDSSVAEFKFGAVYQSKEEAELMQAHRPDYLRTVRVYVRQ